jgi:hypothetical protein
VLFDPAESVVVASPPGDGPGFWAGAPGGTFEDGRFHLVYRLRKPRPERGGEVVIATSEDGERFEKVWSANRKDFASASIERCALVRDGAAWRLYVAHVEGEEGPWVIDVLEADAPDRFDPSRRMRALGPREAGVPAVKDPWLRRIGGEWWMFVSCSSPEIVRTGDPSVRGDELSTGRRNSVTGLATSTDGLSWRWRGIVLDASAGGWDRFTARLSAAVPFGDRWLGLYDGSAGLDENYEERCGVALSTDLVHWRRMSVLGPAIGAARPGPGSVRYVEAVNGPGWTRFFFELTRADGSHELRTARVEAALR